MLPPTDAQGRFQRVLQTAPLWRRVFAKLIDAVLCGVTTFGLSRVLPLPWASALGVGWFIAADWSGSPGKWLLSIRAVTLDGEPISLLASLKRNVMLGLPTFARALLVSGVVGLQGEQMPLDRGLLACVGLAVTLGELVGMVMQPDGRRFGDQFGRTRVVTR